MSVEDAAKLLRIVERSFDDVPRNDYEGSNRYLSNGERLAEAEKRLTEFSGARIHELLAKIDALRARNETVKPACGPTSAPSPTTASGGAGAFALDFPDAEDAVDDRDELAAAEASLNNRAKKKREKKTSKEEKRHAKKAEHPPPALPMPNSSAVGTASNANTQALAEEVQPLSRQENCHSDAIPLVVMGGVGRLKPIPGTALASVTFCDAVLDFEGSPCHCRVELYRCVLLALAYGVPTSPKAKVRPPAPVPAASAPHDEKGGDSNDGGFSNSGAADAASTEEIAFKREGDEDDDDGEAFVGDDSAHLQSLSEELVVLYDAVQAAKEEEESRTGLPTELPAALVTTLRNLTYEPWVILMCAGGYFAGGIFVNGRCVRHKSFQRYVVRKKQGGRQSTNAKSGGGSYGSIGSQIRAAQEVKWKIEVRDLLLEWKQFIDEAAFILYVAPGPQNYTMLTDFSNLPPPSGSGRRLTSPIRLSDPRVAKAPLTTHRPSFSEVERVYETVSKVSIVYIPQG